MSYINRTTLIKAIAERTRRGAHPLRKKDVQLVLNIFLELLADELSKPNGRVGLMGLGILEVRSFRVRGRLKNVQYQGERTSYRIHFRALKCVKDALRKEAQQLSKVDI